MRVKGTAVRSTLNFIKKYFPDQLEVWLNKLPNESREIFENDILVGEWYPAYEAVVIPTRELASIVSKTPEDAAFEVGKYSSNDGLRTVYKVFLRLNSINNILKRAPLIYSNYYDEGKMELLENRKEYGLLRLSGIDPKFYLIIYRVAGWIYGVPQLLRKEAPKIDIKKIQKGDTFEVLLTLKWKD